MELIKYPNPILFKKSEPVKIDKELREFIDQMFHFKQEKLTWVEAVGLAAPQVGRNIRVFIALDNVYINPELTPVKVQNWTRAPS